MNDIFIEFDQDEFNKLLNSIQIYINNLNEYIDLIKQEDLEEDVEL